MYKIEILNDWNGCLEDIHGRGKDVFFMKEYFEVFQGVERGEYEAFSLRTDTNIVVLPYFKRRLGDFIPYTRFPDYYDITSAYGYGGIIARIFDKNLIKLFFNEFHKHCYENKIVTSFIRVHPLLNNSFISLFPNHKKNNKSIFVNTRKDFDVLQKEFKHSVRKNIRKARENGVQVKRYDNIPLDDFREIYQETMERNRADSYYFFSDGFFESIDKNLKNSFFTYMAYLDTKPVSAELVLKSGKYWHSFLGGTLSQYMRSCANSLIKYHIIEDATRSNADIYLIGGGKIYGDNIYKYKRTFAPGSEVDFYIDCSVHDHEVYDALLKEWEDHNPGKVGKVKVFQRYLVI